ncbi:MAG: cytochrome c biogenesis CcdA family protein [Eubacteriales bacterium]
MGFEINVSLWAAFLAGILSFFSPCILPLLPVYVSQLTVAITDKGQGSSRFNWGISLQAMIFIAGFTLVFISLGTASSFIGKFLTFNKASLLKAGGLFVVLMGLNLMDLLPLNLLARHWVPLQRVQPQKSLSSFFLGMSFALGWTPCIGPILASILTLAAATGSAIKGGLLLASYSLGMAIPFLMLCLTFDRFPGLQNFLKKYSRVSLKISGLLLIMLGLLMFFNKLQIFTAYLSF